MGKLDNAGESIELLKPDAPEINGHVPYILVDRVNYTDAAPWPTEADGLGPSLQKPDTSAYGNEPTNWIALAATMGAPAFSSGTNHPPTLIEILDAAASEGTPLGFLASANDPDAGQILTYSLEAGAPTGAHITPGGLFSWTPGETHGGGVYPITVRVTDSGYPPQSDTATFSITVSEVNSPPVLNGPGNRTIAEGNLLSFTAGAQDSDVPAQTLGFSLDAGAPAGASITTDGYFSWTPTEAQGPGTYSITIYATDNGIPSQSAFQTFTVTVREMSELVITSFAKSGDISWTPTFETAVCTIETSPTVRGPWSPWQNFYTSNTLMSARIPLTPSNTFIRILAVDISTNTANHFANLVNSYGLLETIAGTNMPGGGIAGSNYWRSSYEGGLATNACLSRPQSVFGDRDNNLLVVDQGSDSILRITPDGRISTFAGTHVRGFNGHEGWATNIQLNMPNGGWLSEAGTFYILDTENNLVRRVDTNGYLTTIVTNADTGHAGRGLWVARDESVVYWTASTVIRRWTPSGGIETIPTTFGELANIVGNEATGDLFICDPGLNRVFRRGTNGLTSTFAGNGTTSPRTEGASVTEFGLTRPNQICFLPNGGYLISEESPGNCIWYVDPEQKVHRWLNGSEANNAYVGDGQWFYHEPGTAKITAPRSVALDRRGNVIIVENDLGFIRQIRFEPKP